jgi:hypothetical protein
LLTVTASTAIEKLAAAIVNDAEALVGPTELVAVRLTVYDPDTVGVPEITPVEPLILKPDGNPVAL